MKGYSDTFASLKIIQTLRSSFLGMILKLLLRQHLQYYVQLKNVCNNMTLRTFNKAVKQIVID